MLQVIECIAQEVHSSISMEIAVPNINSNTLCGSAACTSQVLILHGYLQPSVATEMKTHMHNICVQH